MNEIKILYNFFFSLKNLNFNFYISFLGNERRKAKNLNDLMSRFSQSVDDFLCGKWLFFELSETDMKMPSKLNLVCKALRLPRNDSATLHEYLRRRLAATIVYYALDDDDDLINIDHEDDDEVDDTDNIINQTITSGDEDRICDSPSKKICAMINKIDLNSDYELRLASKFIVNK